MRAKVNDRVEVEFYDHSGSVGGWQSTKDIIGRGDVKVNLIGYYIGETPASYVFGMCYADKTDHYGPTFNVLKAGVVKWKRIR